MKMLRALEGRGGFEVKFHRIAAEGNAVLTERTDALVFGPLRFQFWVCGVFELHDGQITLWRVLVRAASLLRKKTTSVPGSHS
jgi:limonene-1,2-epoxide hydrolase